MKPVIGLWLILSLCSCGSLGPTEKEKKILEVSRGLEAWFLDQMPSWQGQEFLVLGDRTMGFAFTPDKLVFYYAPKPGDPTPKTVVAAGDFQGWNRDGPKGTMTRQSPREIWTYELPTPEDRSLDGDFGGVKFKLVVDGEWIAPPLGLYKAGLVDED